MRRNRPLLANWISGGLRRTPIAENRRKPLSMSAAGRLSKPSSQSRVWRRSARASPTVLSVSRSITSGAASPQQTRKRRAMSVLWLKTSQTRRRHRHRDPLMRRERPVRRIRRLSTLSTQIRRMLKRRSAAGHPVRQPRLIGQLQHFRTHLRTHRPGRETKPALRRTPRQATMPDRNARSVNPSRSAQARFVPRGVRRSRLLIAAPAMQIGWSPRRQNFDPRPTQGRQRMDRHLPANRPAPGPAPGRTPPLRCSPALSPSARVNRRLRARRPGLSRVNTRWPRPCVIRAASVAPTPNPTPTVTIGPAPTPGPPPRLPLRAQPTAPPAPVQAHSSN